ncbi:MAG: hypothetical protein IPG02_17715 [Ignavibacteria bacterium]|nr:hypothetical protein [Ignavibacteria bacterium]
MFILKAFERGTDGVLVSGATETTVTITREIFWLQRKKMGSFTSFLAWLSKRQTSVFMDIRIRRKKFADVITRSQRI